ncbi:MAG: glycosyltransferase family A protein [archaeon]
MKNTKVSVVIPTYNEEKDIPKAIESLRKQSYKNIEIIIVDDGSSDNTINKIKKFENIRLLRQNHKGPGEARNLGAKNAKGKILAFADSDMTFDKNYIKNLIKPILDNKKIVGTTHDYEVVENPENIWSRCWGKVRIDRRKVDLNGGKLKTAFRAIRKDKFLELGGFDSRYGYADDLTLWFKHKEGPVVAKNTTCYHKNPETFKEVYKQSRWIGASLESWWFKAQIIKYISPIVLIIASPAVIPLLALERCYKNSSFRLLGMMILFMIARYFGTIEGIIRKSYLGKNTR